MDLPLYVPLIRVLEGEMQGTRRTSMRAHKRMCPFFEVVRRRRRSAETPDQYLGRAADLIVETWRLNGPAYVEIIDVPKLDQSWFSTNHPVVLLHDLLRYRSVRAIPIMATYRDVDYREAVIATVKKANAGVGLRIFDNDLEVPSETLQFVRDLVRDAGISTNDVDLIIDVHRLLLDRLPALRSQILDFLAAVDGKVALRSVTVIGSSVPASLDGIPPNQMREIPRLELRLRKELVAAGWANLRHGDYVTVPPEFVDRDGPFPHINGKLLYTLEEGTLVIRGQSRQKEKLEDQYSSIVRRLIASGKFSGSGLGWGDSYIETCSKWPTSPGDPTTWVAVGTCHHLEFASAQTTQDVPVFA